MVAMATKISTKISTKINSFGGQGFGRRALLAGAAGLAGAAVAGCAPPGGSPDRAPAAKRKTGPVTLVNVEHDTRPLDNAAYAKVYKSFHQKHPDITINFMTIPWEQARTKMLTLGQGNGLPNMGRMAYPDDFVAAGMVLSLDDRVSKSDLARFDEAAIASYQAKGEDGKRHLYGLPWFAGSHAIMINKTLVDRAKIDLPDDWTTDQFAQIAAQLTTKGKQWGVTLDGNGIGDPVQILLMTIYAFGGKWVNGDPAGQTPEPIVINSPETAAGISWYVDLYKKGSAVPSAPSDTYQQRDANFLSGKAAMAWQGPWNITATKDAFAKNGYELVSMPLPNGPKGRVAIYGGGGAGIYTSSERDGVVDQAWEWISYLSSDEGEKLYCKTNGMIPASKTAREDPTWSKDPLYTGYLTSMESAPRMYPLWATGLESSLDTIVPPLLQAAFGGKITSEQMAEQLQKQVLKAVKGNGVEVPQS